MGSNEYRLYSNDSFVSKPNNGQKRHNTSASHSSRAFLNRNNNEVMSSYPFRYDNFDEGSHEVEGQLAKILSAPKTGSKIEEVFDFFFADALFRSIFPSILPHSPLAVYFNKLQVWRPNRINRNSVACFMFAPNSQLSSTYRLSFLEWHQALHQQSLIDSGLATAADFILNEHNSHRQNRRAVYEAAPQLSQLAGTRSGPARSTWRYMCHFLVYFIKGTFTGFGMSITNRFLIPYLQSKFEFI